MNPELEAQLANLLESIRQQTEAHRSEVARLLFDIDRLREAPAMLQQTIDALRAELLATQQQRDAHLNTLNNVASLAGQIISTAIG